MKQIEMGIRRLEMKWKILAVAVVALVGVFIMTRFASAESIDVNITGALLDDASWSVGDEPVTWTASAFDSESGEYMSLEDGGSIIWESSDRRIVDFTQSSEGTESTVTLKPVSAGRVKVTATYTKIVTTDEGTYPVTARAERNVVVKFAVEESRIPTVPYEDDFVVPDLITNSVYPVTWTSSNDTVATVEDDGNGNGVVTLQGAGKTEITARNSDGQYITFPMVVNAKFNEVNTPVTIACDEYYTLTTNAKKPSNIVFASANKDIVYVDPDGTAQGISAGNTYLYVYAVNSDDEWYKLLPDPPRSLAVKVDFMISSDTNVAAVGDTIQLNSNISTSKKNIVNWTSSDTSVATVDTNGLVKALKRGTVTINANVVNEQIFGTRNTQSSSVTLDIIDTFSLNEIQHIVEVGDSFELNALVTESQAAVIWSSSNNSVATVTADRSDSTKAVIKGVKKGTAVITATQVINGVSKTASCEVSVTQSVGLQTVTINPSTLSITRGQQYPLIAVFSPRNTDNQTVKWVSSDESVVKVDDQGVVSGIKGGEAVVSVVAEDGIKVAACTISVREPVSGIKLSTNQVTASLSLGNYQLTYTILPSGEGVNRDVTWSSSAPDVLTVNENGYVTFKKPGKATVIVKTVDVGTNGNLIDTCEFYINKPVTAVDLDYTNVTLKIDEDFRLSAKITPADASNQNIIWSSSDTGIVKVDDSGLITGVAGGSATILAKSEDSGATSLCNVTVYQPVTSVTISNESMTVRKGTEFWLNATALPNNAANKEIAWSSGDTRIATVDQNGKVTALEAGTCVINATSRDSGVMARCALTVTQPITGIYLNITERTIMKGDRFVVIPTITPSDADNKNVTFISSDDSVATVDNNGIVTGRGGGVAIIIAKTDERGLVASCQVTVQEFVSSVNIVTDVTNVNIGDSRQVTAEVLPETATNRGLTWNSSNRNVITVDENGRITAVGVGKADLYAYAADGSGVYDYKPVEVVRPVSTITVTPTSLSVPEGGSADIRATVAPSNATYLGVSWESSNNDVAIVDSNGNIIGVSAGTCTITANAIDGSGVSGKCRVTVTPTIPASAVTINAKSVTMLPGQTRELKARIKPTKSTESVQWLSADTSVATVSNTGVVTARGQGNTEIYAISSETGVETSCEIIVLALNATSVTLEQYDSYDLDVFGATQKIKWYSNNKRVATVSANGTVIGRMAGTTTITAKVNGKVLYCTVRVTNMR